jgi:hypothetical protein
VKALPRELEECSGNDLLVIFASAVLAGLSFYCCDKVLLEELERMRQAEKIRRMKSTAAYEALQICRKLYPWRVRK